MPIKVVENLRFFLSLSLSLSRPLFQSLPPFPYFPISLKSCNSPLHCSFHSSRCLTFIEFDSRLTPVWLPSDSCLSPSLYPYFSSNHCDILVCHANRVTFDYQMAASSPVPPAHPFCLISLKWDQSTDPYTSALRTACTAWHDFIWAPAVGSRTPPVLLCILRFCNYRVVSFFG